MPDTPDIDSPYEITPGQIQSFRDRGFINLERVLRDDVLDHYGPEFTRIVRARNKQTLPMAERSTRHQAFIKVINVWKDSGAAKRFVFGKRLPGSRRS